MLRVYVPVLANEGRRASTELVQPRVVAELPCVPTRVEHAGVLLASVPEQALASVRFVVPCFETFPANSSLAMFGAGRV